MFDYLGDLNNEEYDNLKEKLEDGWTANGNCWEWTGKKNKGGYGVLGRHLVHRLSYALFVGNFRKVKFICHTCDNPRCYNPKHLYAGNSGTNGRDVSIRKRFITRSIYRKAIEG